MDLVNLLIYCYVFIFGLGLGSFLNVLIYRSHGDESWWNGRSKCPKCEKTLTWKELVPVFSFVFQKGKCKGCKSPISWQYPVVELLTGLAFLFLVTTFGLSIKFVMLAAIAFLLIGNFVSDLKYMELPDLFSIPSIVLAFAYQLIFKEVSLQSLLLAAFVGGGFFLAQYVLTKGRGIGSGDIRLGILMGVLLGWPLVIPSLMLAYVGGSIIALSLLATKKMTMKSALPLGVFLIPALVIVFLAKEEVLLILNEYLWYNIGI